MDELTAPLGQSRAPRRKSRAPRMIALGLATLLMGVGLWVVLAKYPFRDTPIAVAPAPKPVQAEAPVAPPRAEPERTGAIREPAANDRRTVTIIDGMSGKRQEVVIGVPEPAPAPGGVPGPKSR